MLLTSLALASLFAACSAVPTSQVAYSSSCAEPVVRKEWRALSAPERADWIQAINCLSHLPHDPTLSPSVDPSISLIPPINATSSYYDDLVYVHMDLNSRVCSIHFTGLFLPWHRWYLHTLEVEMKDRCGYTGASPYWNWTIGNYFPPFSTLRAYAPADAPHFFESAFWKDSDPFTGLGGWGDPKADFSVPDGGFRNLHLSYPSPHTLRRNFTLQPFQIPGFQFFPDQLKEGNASFLAPEIQRILDTPAGDFRGFQKAFEIFQGSHTAVHLIMGGDLAGQCPRDAPANCMPGPTWSPNEPLFWLHHGMVDKVWYDWQHRDPANARSFLGGTVQALENWTTYNQYPSGAPPFFDLNSTMPSDGLFPEARIGDVMSTTGGMLCYVYE
ncbi:Di-copper centre-containing protein [Gloeopeniophorella convolvens]|nr:Di-copper centre-containing protein [Gloeopeniophorella convolvens]